MLRAAHGLVSSARPTPDRFDLVDLGAESGRPGDGHRKNGARAGRGLRVGRLRQLGLRSGDAGTAAGRRSPRSAAGAGGAGGGVAKIAGMHYGQGPAGALRTAHTGCTRALRTPLSRGRRSAPMVVRADRSSAAPSVGRPPPAAGRRTCRPRVAHARSSRSSAAALAAAARARSAADSRSPSSGAVAAGRLCPRARRPARAPLSTRRKVAGSR